jgi:hypothetical protein
MRKPPLRRLIDMTFLEDKRFIKLAKEAERIGALDESHVVYEGRASAPAGDTRRRACAPSRGLHLRGLDQPSERWLADGSLDGAQTEDRHVEG